MTDSVIKEISNEFSEISEKASREILKRLGDKSFDKALSNSKLQSNNMRFSIKMRLYMEWKGSPALEIKLGINNLDEWKKNPHIKVKVLHARFLKDKKGNIQISDDLFSTY